MTPNVFTILALARLLGPFDFDYPYNVSVALAVARLLGPFDFDDSYYVVAT